MRCLLLLLFVCLVCVRLQEFVACVSVAFESDLLCFVCAVFFVILYVIAALMV